MYSPETWPAGWAARAQEGRTTKPTAKSNDGTAPCSFIVTTSLVSLQKSIFSLLGMAFKRFAQSGNPSLTFAFSVWGQTDAASCAITRENGPVTWFRSRNG